MSFFSYSLIYCSLSPIYFILQVCFDSKNSESTPFCVRGDDDKLLTVQGVDENTKTLTGTTVKMVNCWTYINREETSFLKTSRHIITMKTYYAPIDTHQKYMRHSAVQLTHTPDFCANVRIVYCTTVATTPRNLFWDGVQAQFLPIMHNRMKILFLLIHLCRMIGDTRLQVCYSMAEDLTLLSHCVQQKLQINTLPKRCMKHISVSIERLALMSSRSRRVTTSINKVATLFALCKHATSVSNSCIATSSLQILLTPHYVLQQR